MGFKRCMITDGGLSRPARAGDGMLTACAITTITADANDTVTVAKFIPGIIQYTGFTVGRTLTTDTAANILAAFPEMDIGDMYLFKVSVVPAFPGTWAAGAGVTIAGRTAAPASLESDVCIVRTGATTVSWTTL